MRAARCCASGNSLGRTRSPCDSTKRTRRTTSTCASSPRSHASCAIRPRKPSTWRSSCSRLRLRSKHARGSARRTRKPDATLSRCGPSSAASRSTRRIPTRSSGWRGPTKAKGASRRRKSSTAAGSTSHRPTPISGSESGAPISVCGSSRSRGRTSPKSRSGGPTTPTASCSARWCCAPTGASRRPSAFSSAGSRSPPSIPTSTWSSAASRSSRTDPTRLWPTTTRRSSSDPAARTPPHGARGWRGGRHMDARRIVERLLRLGGVGVLVLTSVYCLVAYVPFTYEQVIKFGLIGWVTAFAKLHSWIYAAATAALAFTLRQALVGPGSRWVARSFVATQAALAAFLLVHPVIRSLENDATSFVWSVVFLAQLVWLGAVDVAGCRGRLRFDEPEPGREWTVFLAALRTALFVSLLYFAIALARSHAQGDASAGVRDDAVVLAWSVLSHLVLFLALSATFVLVISSARLARTPARAELALSALVAGGVVFVGVREVVLAALSLTGPLADLWAALFALAIVAVLVGAALDGFARRDEAIRDGLAAVLSPLTLAPSSPALARGGALLLVGGAAFAIATNVAVYDSNYLVQKLSVGVVWCLAFALLYTAATRSAGRPGWAAGVLVTAVLALVAFRALETHSRKVSAWLGADAADAAPVLARHSGYDASFKVLYDALAPRIADAASGSAFYRFLQENTNISRATKVDPVDVNLVDDLKPTPGPKPNVFIFVIDSLRRDYLGPYNAAVRFTPSIDAFARESVVMESAFTRYGATGLSEPSIWVGGMMLHKQYIEPFHPMNALQ